MSLIDSYLATRKAYYKFRKQGFGTRASFFKALDETKLDISKYQTGKAESNKALIRAQEPDKKPEPKPSKKRRPVSKQVNLFPINSYHGK